MRHSHRIKEIFRPVKNLAEIATLNAASAFGGVSNRYKFIPTSAPLTVLQDHGWQPYAYAEERVKNQDKHGFQKHAIKLRHPQYSRDNLQNVGDTTPELMLLNSHIGNAAFQLILCLFEKVCSNGLIVEKESLADQRVRHVGYTDQAVADALQAILPAVPQTLADVERFRNIKLLPEETQALSQSAIELRWDGEKFAVDPRHVAYAYRSAQKEDNLWNVTNRLQESLVRGGVYVQNKETGVSTRARAIGSLSESNRLNKAIWTLAEKMAELKSN